MQSAMSEYSHLLRALPYEKEFLFIDGIIFLDMQKLHVRTRYSYRSTTPMIRAHFSGRYVSGNLLTEQVCQTALLLLTAVCGCDPARDIYLGKVTSDYSKPVRPDREVFADVQLLKQQPPAFLFKGAIFDDNEKSAIIQAAAFIR